MTLSVRLAMLTTIALLAAQRQRRPVTRHSVGLETELASHNREVLVDLESHAMTLADLT